MTVSDDVTHVHGEVDLLSYQATVFGNAPINVMPHYPPYGQHTGHTGGFFKKSVPHIGGFDIPHYRDKLATPTYC